MRTPLHRYELTACDSLQDALAALAADPSARPFAGGTDLMVLMDAGHLPPGRYIDLWKVRELRDIDVTAEAVTLGALTTYTEVLKAEVLRREFPMLGIAAAETGGIATQNRGTIGGNIANASPAADTPPALVAYDAELEPVSSRGVRCAATETAVRGHAVDDTVVVKAQRALASEIEPIDDIRSTAAYRLRVAQNVLREFLTRIRA